ncbi:MAG TPA: hypothetical protein ENI73_07690 [Spirochaetes bacterium]|nr:hypothetical protein [Spirochaetota bacterium]
MVNDTGDLLTIALTPDNVNGCNPLEVGKLAKCLYI